MKRTVFLLFALTICCTMLLLGIKLLATPTMQEMVYKVHELSTSATMTDLEKAGFVNLTGIQSQPVEAVDEALFVSGSKKVLTVFVDTGDDLIVQVFERDDDIQAIHMGTEYHVREQYESCCAMRTFAVTPDVVEIEGGVVEVWLRNRTPENWPDVLLYKYQVQDSGKADKETLLLP